MLTMSCSFFFSSRRRHTRLTCDWSSDVCSSDLEDGEPLEAEAVEQVEGEEAPQHGPRGGGEQARERSEERRVGKECRSRWSLEHEKKNIENTKLIRSASLKPCEDRTRVFERAN